MQTHIYLAILIGGLLEGETTVVLAGYAAHQGYAPWSAVVVLRTAGPIALGIIAGAGYWYWRRRTRIPN